MGRVASKVPFRGRPPASPRHSAAGSEVRHRGVQNFARLEEQGFSPSWLAGTNWVLTVEWVSWVARPPKGRPANHLSKTRCAITGVEKKRWRRVQRALATVDLPRSLTLSRRGFARSRSRARASRRSPHTYLTYLTVGTSKTSHSRRDGRLVRWESLRIALTPGSFAH